MALRRIINEPDDILRKRCKAVDEFDKKLWSLIDDMRQTMYKTSGVGLAAPQVGVLKRIVFVDIGEGGIELINPVITKQAGRQREVEGCLSCPDKWGYVKRPLHIMVKAHDRYGKEITFKCSSYLAQCICHEIDHLEGKLFLDYVDQFLDPDDVQEEKRYRKEKRSNNNGNNNKKAVNQ